MTYHNFPNAQLLCLCQVSRKSRKSWSYMDTLCKLLRNKWAAVENWAQAAASFPHLLLPSPTCRSMHAKHLKLLSPFCSIQEHSVTFVFYGSESFFVRLFSKYMLSYIIRKKIFSERTCLYPLFSSHSLQLTHKA